MINSAKDYYLINMFSYTHSPLSSVKVKNGWKYTPLPQYAVMSCKETTLPLYTQISMCLTWDCVVLLYQDPLPWLPLLPRWPLPSSSPRPALLLLWWWRWWWWWCPRRPERGDPTGEVWVSDVTDDLFKQFDVKCVREGRSESVLLLLPEPGWTQNIINWLTSLNDNKYSTAPNNQQDALIL